MESKSSRRFPIRGLIITLVLLLLCGLFAIPMYLSNMIISGVEFCPQLFQKRDFSYYRFPGTKIRFGSTTLSPAASPSSTFVLTHLAVNRPVEWQVSQVSQSTVSFELGPKILLDYLTSVNADGANTWDEWSFKKPAQAKILWPIVQEAAERNLYYCVPELLRIANSDDDLIVLNRKLRMVCFKAAIAKWKSLTDKKDSQTKIEIQEWALSLIDEFSDEIDFQAKKREFNSIEN